RSGRAVSRGAGEPWQDKLLRLPSFLGDPASEPSADELADGFAVTGFFLLRHVFEPRRLALPDARASFVSAVLNATRAVRAASSRRRVFLWRDFGPITSDKSLGTNHATKAAAAAAREDNERARDTNPAPVVHALPPPVATIDLLGQVSVID